MKRPCRALRRHGGSEVVRDSVGGGGLLSGDTEEFVTKARGRYRGLFELLYRINDHAASLLEDFHLEADDAQGILVAGFFLRTIDNVKASTILAERGLSVQSRVVLRAALESQFSLRACLSGEFCERLIVADLVKRNKMIQRAGNLSKIAKVRGLEEMLTSDRIARFKKKVSEIDANDIPIAEIAKAAGCYDLYLGVYATLSASVHSTVYDIERRLVLSEEGQIEALTRGPDIDDIAFLLVGAIEVLLDAAMAAGAFIERDCTEYWKQEHEALRALADVELMETGPIPPQQEE